MEKQINMEKEFVQYEQALALKELGFDEECFKYYVDNKLIQNDLGIKNKDCEWVDNQCTAPLYQQAFKFVLGIIESDSKLERKFGDRYFLDFSSEGFQMDDKKVSTTYESDEETLKNITNFIILNK
jgi:hypothetical protein